MKKIFLVLLITIFSSYLFVSADLAAENSSSYGLYGTIKYPSAIVSSAVVVVYKTNIWGTYVYHGQTTASSCGYYTYDTGGIGQFRVVVSGTYSLRYETCGSVFATDPVAGDNYGSITISTPQRQLNIMTY